MKVFFDTRRHGSRGTFAAEPVNRDFVRLVEVSSRRSHIEVREVFSRNYESIEWGQ